MRIIPEPEGSSSESSPQALLKIDAVAKALGIPVSTAYEYVRQNRIGGIVRVGRHIRINKAKFEAWLEAGGESNQAHEIT
jgi:excisionase family DNA binding protein